MGVSMNQQFVEHAVFQKTLRVPNSCSAKKVEILPKYPATVGLIGPGGAARTPKVVENEIYLTP
jgi:hypothetical protein